MEIRQAILPMVVVGMPTMEAIGATERIIGAS